MIDKYDIIENDVGEVVLVDPEGSEVYNWGADGWQWPDDAAIEAMIADAGISNPQKAFFATAFLGPDINIEDDTGDN